MTGPRPPHPAPSPPARAGGEGTPFRGLAESPPHRLAPVLLVEPLLERREVVADRRRVHLALARQRLERVGPRLRLAHLERLLQPIAGRLVAVDRAAVERPRAARRLRERAVKLELEDVG